MWYLCLRAHYFRISKKVLFMLILYKQKQYFSVSPVPASDFSKKEKVLFTVFYQKKKLAISKIDKYIYKSYDRL